MSNSFGKIFTLTSFGESHGHAIGGIVDGMPAGVKIDIASLQHQLDRRRPGQSAIVTQRNESDKVTLLSGIFEGITTGTPIGFIVPNSDSHSGDYDEMRHTFRPSHADYTYTAKYGIRDHRGGGRSSARETVARVVAGALAMQALRESGISIVAYTSSVGEIKLNERPTLLDVNAVDATPVRCPDPTIAQQMIDLIKEVKSEGDTIGGTVDCIITGCPAGLGEPVFDKLQARLAQAMMSINAAKGFEYGMGFSGCRKRGSQVADKFVARENGEITTSTNNSGGIQGGISNGNDICFRVAFKPVATLLRDIETIDDRGNPTTLHARGRHDPCVVPRAVPIVEAMAAMTILDMILLNRAAKI